MKHDKTLSVNAIQNGTVIEHQQHSSKYQGSDL